MLNHIVIMGRLTRDPELRRTGSGTAVTSFTVAVDRDFSKEKVTDFFDCVAWQSNAEFAQKFLHKGSLVSVVGSIQFRDWTDKDGNKRKTTELKVDHIYFAESRKNAASAAPADTPDELPENFSIIEDDDGQLPF